MNTVSASRAEPARRGDPSPATAHTASILVWDLPVRVFHWLLAASFGGAWITAESERWRLMHVTLGYTLAGLVVFRLLWGVLGTRHARFANFVRGPGSVWRYLRSLVRAEPEHHAGHNPAGSWAIVALMTAALAVAVSGWAVYGDIGGDILEEVHEFAANLMIGIVVVHLAGVVTSSWLHRENLVRAMVTGRKNGRPEDGITAAWRSVGALMIVAVLGFWVAQWQSAPGGAALAAQRAAGVPMTAHRASDLTDDD